MKIGFVLDDGLDKPDGVQQYILTLGNWYSSQGHEVAFLVGETKRRDIKNIHSLSRNIKVSFNGNRMSIPLSANSLKIKKLLAKENFDVLHVQVPYSPFMGAKVIKSAPPNTAIFGTFHILPYGWIANFGTQLLGLYLKRNLKRFDEIVSVSKPASDFAKKTFKIDTAVIPNAVNLNEFKVNRKINKASSEAYKIVFLGRLVQRKGAQNLIKSLIILNEKKLLPSNVAVDICGDGPMRSQLEALVNEANMKNIIKFHGFITQKQKVDFLSRANLAVFPSISGESFGIVLVEAIASGADVVLGGENPGYISVLKDERSIISSVNPEKSADQILAVINNKELQQDLNNFQQQLIKQYDVTVVGKELIGRYQACKNLKTDHNMS